MTSTVHQCARIRAARPTRSSARARTPTRARTVLEARESRTEVASACQASTTILVPSLRLRPSCCRSSSFTRLNKTRWDWLGSGKTTWVRLGRPMVRVKETLGAKTYSR